MTDKKADNPTVCDGCKNWNQFGKECWAYWEGKKVCTQHSDELRSREKEELFAGILKDY